MESKKIIFKHKLLILGFGSIGQAVLPLLFKHIEVKQFLIEKRCGPWIYPILGNLYILEFPRLC